MNHPHHGWGGLVNAGGHEKDSARGREVGGRVNWEPLCATFSPPSLSKVGKGAGLAASGWAWPVQFGSTSGRAGVYQEWSVRSGHTAPHRSYRLRTSRSMLSGGVIGL